MIGRSCFQIYLDTDLNPDSFHDALTTLSDEITTLAGKVFIACRLPATYVSPRRTLEKAGFHLIECYLELEADLEGIKLPAVSDNVQTRLHNESDIPHLSEIAYNSFSDSRFHSDPLIPDKAANESRADWVRNACNGRADFVFVAGKNGDIAGFVIGTQKANFVNLDLIATSSLYRRKGIGRHLTNAFLKETKRRGASKARVGTQAQNKASLIMYQKCGFFMSEASFSYHLHG